MPSRAPIKSEKMSAAIERRINGVLAEAGLDGNGRFRSPGHAYGKIASILDSFGYEFSSVLQAWDVKNDQGRLTLDISKSHPENRFYTTPVSNSSVVFSWYKLRPDTYEVLAYLG